MNKKFAILARKKAKGITITTDQTTQQQVGITLTFEGSGVDEIAFISNIDTNTLKKYGLTDANIKVNDVVLKIDKEYFRPTEVDLLVGDPSKAKKKLNWKPKYNLDALIEDMLTSDIKHFKKEEYLKKGGYKISKDID